MGKFSKMHCAKNPFKKMDAMYNGKPGIQKEDFEQFSDLYVHYWRFVYFSGLGTVGPSLL